MYYFASWKLNVKYEPCYSTFGQGLNLKAYFSSPLVHYRNYQDVLEKAPHTRSDDDIETQVHTLSSTCSYILPVAIFFLQCVYNCFFLRLTQTHLPRPYQVPLSPVPLSVPNLWLTPERGLYRRCPLDRRTTVDRLLKKIFKEMKTMMAIATTSPKVSLDAKNKTKQSRHE